MFKFVGSNGGNPQKRMQISRACETCRKRKKRCCHTTASPGKEVPCHGALPSPSPSIISQGVQNNDITSSPSPPASHNDGSTSSAIADVQAGTTTTLFGCDLAHREHSTRVQALGGRDSRFIGDLSPEAIFRAATSPNATRGDESVGLWLPKSQTTLHYLQSPANIFHSSGSFIKQALMPLLEQECLSTVPSLANFEALSKIYFEKVHPIFPVVDEPMYRGLAASDPDHVILRQGICLAASKNFAARRHLILGDGSTPLSCRDFGDKTSGAMRMSIEMRLVTDKLVVIQALGFMSQFTDDAVGEDLSSEFCSKAVHNLQSLGLHLNRQHEEQSTIKLLCCIWAIDRMSAAFNGRPVLMHERDIRNDMDDCIAKQEPGFRLFLRVILLLDKVIYRYRPQTKASEHLNNIILDFPAFEEVVLNCGASQINTVSLATIETLYHAIAILSCRSKTWAEPEPTSTGYLRQSLSTSILISSTSVQQLQEQLTLLPFVPYAISLSMSIVYREMRHSKLPLHRSRTRAQFQTLCDSLSELEGIFWSAKTMSGMGKKLLREIDRVFSTVAQNESRRCSPPNTGNNANMVAEIGVSVLAAQHNREQLDLQPISFDLPVFNLVPDLDFFGMFEPTFDLDGFDACLESNLNPAFPTQFQ